MKSFLPLALVSLLGRNAQQAQQDDGLIVTTKQGEVVGTQVCPGVRRFLGIPYATAGRWEAPNPPPEHADPYVASNFGNACPQRLGLLDQAFANVTGNGDVAIPPEGEDCLTVNVWAPSSQRAQGGAVLLWVYGGGFQSGTANSPTYDGSSIVENFDDILVVTFNYRTNILGQPNAPQLVNDTKSQNFGLLDIDAAVQWVYDNIASFGGDPERITLFGQSAGAVAVDAYAYMHPEDKRVKGLIQMSGNLGAAYPQTLGPVPANITFNPQPWNNVAKAAGCGDGADDAQLQCMKNKPYETLVQAVLDTNTTLVPLIDDITLFSDAGVRAAADNYLRVPLLAGTTANEQDLVVAAEVAVLGYSIPVLTELLSDVLTQISLGCPTQQALATRLQSKVSTWRYLYEGVFKDISPRPDLRAYHTAELPVLFGALSSKATTDERGLSNYMQGAWVAFARNPQNGLLEYGWPQYEPKTESLVNLGGFYNATGANFSKGEQQDFTCNDPLALVDILQKLVPMLPPGVTALLGF